MSKETSIVILLDRSGSMAGLESDTVKGIQKLIDEQKKVKGKCYFSLYQFDSVDPDECIIDNKDLQNVTWDGTSFIPRGTTPLLDAIGKTIAKTKQRVTDKTKVLFVIVTDGLENASREWNKAKVKEVIEERTEKGKWEFIYLGANQDAIKEAANYGISPQSSATYNPTRASTTVMYNSVSNVISASRAGGLAAFAGEARVAMLEEEPTKPTN